MMLSDWGLGLDFKMEHKKLLQVIESIGVEIPVGLRSHMIAIRNPLLAMFASMSRLYLEDLSVDATLQVMDIGCGLAYYHVAAALLIFSRVANKLLGASFSTHLISTDIRDVPSLECCDKGHTPLPLKVYLADLVECLASHSAEIIHCFYQMDCLEVVDLYRLGKPSSFDFVMCRRPNVTMQTAFTIFVLNNLIPYFLRQGAPYHFSIGLGRECMLFESQGWTFEGQDNTEVTARFMSTQSFPLNQAITRAVYFKLIGFQEGVVPLGSPKFSENVFLESAKRHGLCKDLDSEKLKSAQVKLKALTCIPGWEPGMIFSSFWNTSPAQEGLMVPVKLQVAVRQGSF